MITPKQKVLMEMGFKPAASLEEALKADFIIDTYFGSVNDIAIYAVTKKAETKSGTLYLNGTIIRHTMSTDNLKQITIDEYIAEKLIAGDNSHLYKFTQKEVEKKHNLWIFDPAIRMGAPEWWVHVRERAAFRRRYKEDIAKYSNLLQANPLQK